MYTVPDQAGRTFIVTGANSGTGKEATRRLAGAGAKVIMAVRNLTKGEDARREILESVPNADLGVRRVDLAEAIWDPAAFVRIPVALDGTVRLERQRADGLDHRHGSRCRAGSGW